MQATCYHDDKPRLAGQTAAIVERLRQGPARNHELAALSLKYTSRISDDRAAGYGIDCERLADGVTEYRLTRDPDAGPAQLELIPGGSR
jgi:hypothetical protein